MAECKLNKIMVVCEKWKSNHANSECAMQEIQSIVDLKESEMPPCNCNAKQETMPHSKNVQGMSCPMKPSPAYSCPPMSKEMASCPMPNSKSCHGPGPSKPIHVVQSRIKNLNLNFYPPVTVNPFFNFLKELRETTCYNKSVTEVAKEAGQRWSKMTDCEKGPYILEAYKVSRKRDDISSKRMNSSCSMSEPKAKSRKMN